MKENAAGESPVHSDVALAGAAGFGTGASQADSQTRADNLLRALKSSLRTSPSGTAVPEPPNPPLLAWLRRVYDDGLYRDADERELSRRLGPDLFADSDSAAAPRFLGHVDQEALPAAVVRPFLRRISLTRTIPAPAELALPHLLTDPGPVHPLTGDHSDLGPATATQPGIPAVIHGIWLGGPAPAGHAIRANFSAAAARYGAELTFVVWTDVTRAEAMGARPGSAVASWIAWAAANDIALVSVDEVFHAGAPMVLQRQYRLERAKRLPRGWAGASDHLRLEVLARFGGVYLDADIVSEPSADGGPEDATRGGEGWVVPRGLPDLAQAVASGPAGFTVHVREAGVAADVVVSAAGHPALLLWREIIRTTGACGQRQLFGSIDAMTALGPGLPAEDVWRRYAVPCRAGLALGVLLSCLGFTLDDARLVRVHGAVRPVETRSWSRTDAGPGTVGEPVTVARDLVTATVRRLIAREGDLQLTAIAPVIEAQPDPEPLWVAVLTLIGELAGGWAVPPVRSVTEAVADNTGRIRQVRLPEAARRLLRTGKSAQPWIGAELAPGGEPVWLLGELVRPCGLSSSATVLRATRGASSKRVAGEVARLHIPAARAEAAAIESQRTAAHLFDVLLRAARDSQKQPAAPVPLGLPELEGRGGEKTLEWLRGLIGLPIGEPGHERRLLAALGPDLFGLRRLPPQPGFLAGVDVRRIPPNRVASFFAGISLTRLDGTFTVPAAGELAPERLVRQRVSRVRAGRDWGVPGAPALRSGSAIPHVVHGIWVGGPIPRNGLLRINFGAAARHYADRVSFVVWTDITRAEAIRALAAPDASVWAGEVVSMLAWAREHAVQVVAVNEVFHAEAPMRLWNQYVADLMKLLPRGYAGASERLRLEVLTRFGGAYVDSDDRFLFPTDEREPQEVPHPQTIPALITAVARSIPVFTPQLTPPDRVNCDVIVAPAGHPALLLWRELDRLACSLGHRQLFGEAELLQRRAGAAPERLWHRYTVPKRAGLTHCGVLQHLGFRFDDPRLVRVMGAVREQSARSWTKSSGRAPRSAGAAPSPAPLPAATLARVVTSLARRLISRPGNLHLSAVAPVVNALPDPDAAWTGLLRLLALLAERGAIAPITSVTRFRWADDGSPEYVGLPASAEILLEHASSSGKWFGEQWTQAGHTAWVLDEAVVPVRLVRRPSEPVDGSVGRAVVTQAPWLPAGFAGVSLQGRAGAAWVGRHRVTPEDVAARLAGVGVHSGPVLLRMSGGPEHGGPWFAARLQILLGRPVLLTHEPGAHQRPRQVSTATELRASEEASRVRRGEKAADLLAGLQQAAPPAAVSTRAFVPPAHGAGKPPVPERVRPALGWLRGLTDRRLYTAELETDLNGQMGPDPYLRRARPARPTWQTVETATLPAEGVATFLRWLDLADPDLRAEPCPGELGVRMMHGARGQVSRVSRSGRSRRWAPKGPAPALPGEVVVPHLIHGIWLGGPLPDTGGFRSNYAHAAREYAGRVDFVLWTDVTRAESLVALGGESTHRAARIRSMLTWARENGVLIVNFAEVLHEQADVVLWAQIAAERARRNPRAYAAASDHLRVEIVHLLGGAYVDGDNRFVGDGALGRLFDEVAASRPAFTLNVVDAKQGVANDVIIAPAGHPALRLWRELARLQYLADQPRLFGGVSRMTERFVHMHNALLRYSVVRRTGRLHHQVLAAVGLGGQSELLVRPGSAIDHRSELSWVPGLQTRGPAETGREQVLEQLLDVVTVLSRQLVNRRGNLYLSEVAPVIDALPDPDAAWIAVLTQMASFRAAGAVPPVSSVTDTRWDESGQITTVLLPPEAESLLVRQPRASGWLGAELNTPGQPVWLADECVEPARLRSPDQTGEQRQVNRRRLRPVTVRRDGVVLGLRYHDGIARAVAGVVPAGNSLVWVRRWCAQPYSDAGRITAEDMAADLIAADLHRQPVIIVCTPGERTSGGGAEAGLGGFAAALKALLGVLVTVVNAPVARPRPSLRVQVSTRQPVVRPTSTPSPGRSYGRFQDPTSAPAVAEAGRVTARNLQSR